MFIAICCVFLTSLHDVCLAVLRVHILRTEAIKLERPSSERPPDIASLLRQQKISILYYFVSVLRSVHWHIVILGVFLFTEYLRPRLVSVICTSVQLSISLSLFTGYQP